MSLLIQLRNLETTDLRLQGEVAPEKLELVCLDELIHARTPVRYDFQVQQLDRSILVQGRIELDLDCECVRCLTPVRHRVVLERWACDLPLDGEDKVVVVNDTVDLTPYLREDILLAFPRHPLCKPDCAGVVSPRKNPSTDGTSEPGPAASAWSALDKLKLN